MIFIFYSISWGNRLFLKKTRLKPKKYVISYHMDSLFTYFSLLEDNYFYKYKRQKSI